MERTLSLLLFMSLLLPANALAQSDGFGRGGDTYKNPNLSVARPQDGFRMEFLAGATCWLSEIGDPAEQEMNTLGFHIAAAPTYIFKNNSHAIGLMYDYRVHGGSIRDFDRSAGLLRDPKPFIENMSFTTFLAPVYTYVAKPYARNSFFADAALGYVYHAERVVTFGYRRLDWNTVGCAASAGWRAKITYVSDFFVKATLFYSSFKNGEGDQKGTKARSNISSINLSVGLTLGGR